MIGPLIRSTDGRPSGTKAVNITPSTKPQDCDYDWTNTIPNSLEIFLAKQYLFSDTFLSAAEFSNYNLNCHYSPSINFVWQHYDAYV